MLDGGHPPSRFLKIRSSTKEEPEVTSTFLFLLDFAILVRPVKDTADIEQNIHLPV